MRDGGTRPQRGLLRGYRGAIERLSWGYRGAIERFIIYLD